MMIKKILSVVILFSIIFSSNLWFTSVYAVETNNSSSPWTIEKARHLAKKWLLWATQQQIDQLLAVWSAENAVNVLFPSRSGPSRTSFNELLNNLTEDPGFNPSNAGDIYEYYLTKKTFDPYEAKSKLFLLIEDIYSVNISWSKDITYLDIENTHDLLYDYTLWNYKDMVKRSLYNNWNPWDYSISQFLDLLDQTNPEQPNQNYAREILQLLLMGENIPTESPETGWIRNYTETEVNNLAKILVWFQSNENTHEVTYNNAINTNTDIAFLDGELKAWDEFPFYNTSSGTINVQDLKISIDWNNWLPDNIIDYIFSKRDNEIALFLADKIYRFYVADFPTRSELNIIANQILINDFDLYLSVKWLLSNDIMYSDKSMNSIIYKNPIELTAGTAKLLWLTSVLNIDSSMRTLGWTPYLPWSIFWRDWFDENKNFFNTNTSTRWASEASRIVNEIDIDAFINKSLNINELITDLELRFYWDPILPTDVIEKLINFMSFDEDWNEVIYDLNDDNYNNFYTKWLIHLILIQPEYILQSWYDIPSQSQDNIEWFYNNDNRLVTVYFWWGLDWLHAIIPQDEYPQYLEKRLTWALTWTWVIELDDNYYINAAMQPFKDLYDSWDLKIINRVWTEDHSRWHDSARTTITSLNNDRSRQWPWIIWSFIENENPLKTLTLSRWWIEFRWGQSLNVWSDWLYRIADSTNNGFRIHKIDTIKDIYSSRDYPRDLDFIFKNWVQLWNVAEASVANGWRWGAWTNMIDNFIFAENLFDAWVSNVLSMHADGWYDSHRNQKDSINANLERVAERTADFYNRVKDKQNITIVLYSEFWRTTQINSSVGTDHWKWGGMFILSNNEELKTSLPEKIYWNNSFVNAQANRLWVGVDYRWVYNRLFKDLYNQDLSSQLGEDYDILDDTDTQAPDSELFSVEFREDRWQTNARLRFEVNDTNFQFNQGSHIEFFHWTDPDNLDEVSFRTVNRMVSDNVATLNIWIIPNETEYFYKVNIFDNQYNLKVLEWSFISPQLNERDNLRLNTRWSTRFSSFTNRNITGNQVLSEWSQIILSEENPVTFFWEDNITMSIGTWTIIESLETNWELINWDWWFVLLEDIDIESFIDNEATLWVNNIEDLRIDKIVKVWADTLWVGMNLNKPVEINIPWLSRSKNYAVLSSEDWILWDQIERNNINKSGSDLSFSTDHFTFFALAESNNNGSIIINQEITSDLDDNTVENNNSSRSRWSSWNWVKLVRDDCKYWDYSQNYYDKSCWKSINAIELYKLIENQNIVNSIWFNDENDEINFAILELQDYEWDKFNIYSQLFLDVNSHKNDQEKVLTLLREGMSSTQVWDYEIHYIKWSDKNVLFKKIVELFINKAYSKEYEEKIVKSINEIILSYAIVQLDGLTSNTINIAKQEFQNSVISLKYNYELAIESIKKYTSLEQSRIIYTKEKTQQTEDYYKSRKDAILRKYQNNEK